MMRPFEHPVACYCVLLRVFACCCVLLRFVAHRLEPVKLLSQQIPTFLSFVPWSLKRNVTMVDPFAQLLLKSFNIVGATHTYKTWLTNELYPSQQCWELLHPLAQHCQHGRNNSQHCWANNVWSWCVRLHVAWQRQTNGLTTMRRRRRTASITESPSILGFVPITTTSTLTFPTILGMMGTVTEPASLGGTSIVPINAYLLWEAIEQKSLSPLRYSFA